jgi:hypothetical protein
VIDIMILRLFFLIKLIEGTDFFSRRHHAKNYPTKNKNKGVNYQ